MSDVAGPHGTTSDPAARRRSEGFTLVFAVTVAVALGVACGIWLNARLTPHNAADPPQPTRLLPDARPDAPPANAAQPTPCEGCGTASVVEVTSARKEEEAAPKTEVTAAATPAESVRATAPDVPAEPSPTAEVAEASAEPKGAMDPGASAASSPDPDRPVAWQVGTTPRARANVGGGSEPAGARAAEGGAQGQPGPCSLYTSASALSVSVGGAAPLILGGPGVGVRINVTTPDWTQLAVIYGGPAAGRNGWLRYSVKSVGRRPGNYTVHVSSPCGSQTIPVTVK